MGTVLNGKDGLNMIALLKEAREIAWETLEVTGHCLWQASTHPRTQITQVANPVPIQMSPVPWWGCGMLILVGIGSWIAGAILEQVELREASRLLVYMPLMHLFDRGYETVKRARKKEN